MCRLQIEWSPFGDSQASRASLVSLSNGCVSTEHSRDVTPLNSFIRPNCNLASNTALINGLDCCVQLDVLSSLSVTSLITLNSSSRCVLLCIGLMDAEPMTKVL